MKKIYILNTNKEFQRKHNEYLVNNEKKINNDAKYIKNKMSIYYNNNLYQLDDNQESMTIIQLPELNYIGLLNKTNTEVIKKTIKSKKENINNVDIKKLLIKQKQKNKLLTTFNKLGFVKLEKNKQILKDIIILKQENEKDERILLISGGDKYFKIHLINKKGEMFKVYKNRINNILKVSKEIYKNYYLARKSVNGEKQIETYNELKILVEEQKAINKTNKIFILKIFKQNMSKYKKENNIKKLEIKKDYFNENKLHINFEKFNFILNIEKFSKQKKELNKKIHFIENNINFKIEQENIFLLNNKSNEENFYKLKKFLEYLIEYNKKYTTKG